MTLTTIFLITIIAGFLITGILSLVRKPESWLHEILSNFVGSFLIFSGAVKAIDPLGTSYKMHDYFAAFGGIFDSFQSFNTPLAVFMIVLEIVLGFALIIGFQKKLSVWLTFLMILFFTFLTGYTYLNGYINPDYFDETLVEQAKTTGEKIPYFTEFDPLNMKVTDCGCFGDFLKLEPKVSFFKDIFLIVVIIFLLLGVRKLTTYFEKSGVFIIGGITLISLLFCFNNFAWDLPSEDFRPYKVGNYIPNLMIAEREDSIEYIFVYENEESQEVKDFPISNLPKAPWKFKSRKENVIVRGIQAKISNFYVENESGEEVTEDILHDENFSFWIVAYKLESTNQKVFTEKLNPLAEKAEAKGYTIFAMAGDANDEFRHDVQAAYPFYQGDETFLKTIIRSNPGLLLIKNGTVIAKWHHKKIPSFETIEKDYLTK